MNPCGLRFVLHLGLGGDSRAVVLQAPVLLLLLLLLLQDVRHRVQQIVEEFVCILLHVVVEQICRETKVGREQRSLSDRNKWVKMCAV